MSTEPRNGVGEGDELHARVQAILSGASRQGFDIGAQIARDAMSHQSANAGDATTHPIGSPVELSDGHPDITPWGPRRFEIEDILAPNPTSSSLGYLVRPIGSSASVRLPAGVVRPAPPFPGVVLSAPLGRQVTLYSAAEAESMALGMAARLAAEDTPHLGPSPGDRPNFFTLAMALASWAQVAPDILLARLEAKAAPIAAERRWANRGLLGYPPGADVQVVDGALPFPRHAVVSALHRDAIAPRGTWPDRLVREGGAQRIRQVTTTCLGPALPFPPLTVRIGTFRSRAAAERALIDAAAVLELPTNSLQLHGRAKDLLGRLHLDVTAMAEHLARWFAPASGLTGADVRRALRPHVLARLDELLQASPGGSGRVGRQRSAIAGGSASRSAPIYVSAVEFPAAVRPRGQRTTGAFSAPSGSGPPPLREGLSGDRSDKHRTTRPSSRR